MDGGNSLMTSVLATGTFNEVSLVHVPFVHDVINNNTWLVWLLSLLIHCRVEYEVLQLFFGRVHEHCLLTEQLCSVPKVHKILPYTGKVHCQIQ